MAKMNFDFSFVETNEMAYRWQYFLKTQFQDLFLCLFAWYEHNKTTLREALKKKRRTNL